MTLQPGFHFSNCNHIGVKAAFNIRNYDISDTYINYFSYQCINLHHFFLLINIYELRFLYQSHDTKYKYECPKMFK